MKLEPQEDVEMTDETENQDTKADIINMCKLMLTVDPEKRPSAQQLLDHDFFTTNKPLPCDPSELFANMPDFPGFTSHLNEHSARNKSRAARGMPQNQGQLNNVPQGNLSYLNNLNAHLRRAA